MYSILGFRELLPVHPITYNASLSQTYNVDSRDVFLAVEKEEEPTSNGEKLGINFCERSILNLTGNSVMQS